MRTRASGAGKHSMMGRGAHPRATDGVGGRVNATAASASETARTWLHATARPGAHAEMQARTPSQRCAVRGARCWRTFARPTHVCVRARFSCALGALVRARPRGLSTATAAAERA